MIECQNILDNEGVVIIFQEGFAVLMYRIERKLSDMGHLTLPDACMDIKIITITKSII